MHRVLILGAGKIGSLVAQLLASNQKNQVILADRKFSKIQKKHEGLERLTGEPLNAQDPEMLDRLMQREPFNAVVSCLPYYCNSKVAELAKHYKINYFDLTEDVAVTKFIKSISNDADIAMVPQCGLAPGFISIAANDLVSHFEQVDTVKMRVGALPINPNNILKYSLTWSTDGLINEYGNRCQGIENGEAIELLPLEGYETITIDGVLYEAFNTSGGLGSLAETHAGKIRNMTYKTMRYPGHCEKIHLLMNDLKLNEDRDTLKRILENAIPKTKQDVVLIYTSVSGKQQGELYEENYVKKIYPATIFDKTWSAIQVTTAAGICAVVDIILESPKPYKGFVTQETFGMEEFLDNQFGNYYA